jgi:hypothetical protein
MKFLILTFLSLVTFSQFGFAASTTKASDRKVPFFNVDISGSAGNYNGKTYSEVQLGLNLNFTDWFTWRNAAFKRFGSAGDPDVTGLDSSLRFTLAHPFDGGSVRLFGGPGYRWADPSTKNAVFGELGAGVQLGRFGISAGGRFLKYDQIQYDSSGVETKREDISYFVTIAGGAGLSF